LVRPSVREQREVITVTVVLKRTDPAGFARYLSRVSAGLSAERAPFLTPAQQATRFGPSLSAYRSVEAWLFAQGFRLVQGSSNRLSLSVRGSRVAAERAFGAPIDDAVRRGMRPGYTNVIPPHVPPRLAAHVAAVIGLSNLDEPTLAPADQYEDPNTTAEDKCKQAWYNPGPTHEAVTESLVGAVRDLFLDLVGSITSGLSAVGFNPYVIGYCIGAHTAENHPEYKETITNFDHFILGAAIRRRNGRRLARAASLPSQKIGLLEFDTYRASDVADWLNLMNFDPSLQGRLSEVPVNGGVTSPGAGESEVLLDIDTVIGAASLPDTSYVVYDAPPSASFVQMFQRMIADGDTVIANSWSQCEDQTPLADAQAIDSVLASAEASGVTVVNGAGDSGSTCLDGTPNTVGVPADSPHATAVGGVSPTPGPGLTYGSEMWWDDRNATPPGGAGGFGTSRYFGRPAYQTGLTTSPSRSVPDLAEEADPAAGLELCQSDAGGCPSGLLFGGTSMAAPLVAGLVADLNLGLGRDVGGLNALVYPLAQTGAFHQPQALGSDFAHVGLGSPNFTSILQHLAGVATGPVSGTQSRIDAFGDPQADGQQQGIVRVDLTDAYGLPVSGKTVTLTPNAGSSAVVTPASATTDANDGAAVFTVTDTVPEAVTVTASDASDHVAVAGQTTLTFAQPVASGAMISAAPTTVASDGSATTTISVYLQNALGRPAAGKTVSLSNLANAMISPNSGPDTGQATTGADGVATFMATDATQEAVSFTATDVTDGNLPVPGSAVVNFEPQGSSQCGETEPTPASGFSVSDWATGLPFNAQDLPNNGSTTVACALENKPVFDASGNVYLANSISGQVYKLGDAGGAVTSASALPQANIPLSSEYLAGLALGKSGELYASTYATGGDGSQPQLLRLDPTTGATIGVLATSAAGMPECPEELAVDPVSGDVFTDTLGCTGFPGPDEITRIANPDSGSPTISGYADVGDPAFGMAFAPDGTLYVAVATSNQIVAVSGTNGPATPTVTPVATLDNQPVSVAVAATDQQGHATALDVSEWSGDPYSNITGTGSLERIDLTQNPAVVTSIATGADKLGGIAVGPDGCLYVNELDKVLKVTGSCTGPSVPGIQLAATSGLPSPAAGSAVSFQAAFQNVSVPAGTPVEFVVSGANPQVKLVRSDASGHAAFSYSGVFPGSDSVVATATVNGTQLTSAPEAFRWAAGKDTTFLTLNNSPESGLPGQPVTLTANLTDVTTSPASALGRAPVTISLSGSSCNATTDAAGNVSCTITPSGGQALGSVTASYAGDATHTPATASNVFEVGGVGFVPLPASTSLPAISGTARAGNTLTCSRGGWTNAPTSFSYQWSRNGTPISGATGSTYKVVQLDEGSALTCTVTASNLLGKGGSATSKAVTVAVPKVKGCPKATGTVAGTHLGHVSLGMTRSQARRAYRTSSNRGKKYEDFFCLIPIGVRVGYASPKLLALASKSERGKLKNRVVWISTANPIFAIDGIRAGATLSATKAVIAKGSVFTVGRNSWYLAKVKQVTAIFKVRHGLVEEIGIADLRLTRTAKADRSFLRSFS
jgi:hypothetical protein